MFCRWYGLTGLYTCIRRYVLLVLLSSIFSMRFRSIPSISSHPLFSVYEIKYIAA